MNTWRSGDEVFLDTTVKILTLIWIDFEFSKLQVDSRSFYDSQINTTHLHRTSPNIDPIKIVALGNMPYKEMIF